LYIVGLWSYGGGDIKISSVYVTNNSNYSPPTALEKVAVTFDENELVDVYSLMGVRIRSKVVRKEATNGLPAGLYLVGRQKVMVSGVR
jgi:hypothetical protein